MKSRGEKRFRLRRRSRVSRGSRLGRGVVVVSWVAGVGSSGGLVEVVGLDMVGGVVIAIDPAGGNCSLSCCSKLGGSWPGGHAAIYGHVTPTGGGSRNDCSGVVAACGCCSCCCRLIRFSSSSISSSMSRVDFCLSAGRPRRQRSLSCAIVTSSSNVMPCGTSMKILPGRLEWNCVLTASLTRRLSGILSICPSQRYLRCLMAPTRSNERERGLASACALKPVMWERQLALQPLSFAIVLSVRCQASLP